MAGRETRRIKPLYSRNQVNKAGDAVRQYSASPEDLEIIENWRAAHNKILNDWQSSLRGRCKAFPSSVTLAQRLKRRNTIFHKLQREPGMRLARMHDIAGCRLIFTDLNSIEAFRASLHSTWSKHKRRKAKAEPYPYDYISSPKKSGYRGIHDIYSYKARPGRDTAWDGLTVEIQYRTEAQHAWATAVEIAGSLTGHYTKFDEGEELQKEFFRLTSEIIARCTEHSHSCYPNKTAGRLVKDFENVESKINLLRHLSHLKTVGTHWKSSNRKELLNLVLVSNQEGLMVHSFGSLAAATENYFRLEKNNPSSDVVLVRTTSEEHLKKAYKNYFTDTAMFVNLVRRGLRFLRIEEEGGMTASAVR